MEKEAWHLSQFIVTWLTRTTLEWQSSVTTVKTEPWCKDVNLKDATNVIFTTLGQIFSSWETTTSAHCEQFIKFECHRAMLLYNGHMFGWWVSRDGDKITYWGGSNSTYFYKCACGVTGTCADIAYGCNCDKNDLEWREDSGLLTTKSHLPVKQLKFGDTTPPDELGYHTLGKLRCYGTSTK